LQLYCFYLFRRFLILEDQYKQNNQELNDNLAKIKELIPSDEENKRKEVERKHWLHVLAHQEVRLNNAIGENKSLKGNIDIARQEVL